ncbi:DUF805 domain-containing protein [Arthrobacter sp. NPDC056691]|uniref:DUF805 domain-containing protein n=1 Tax=Arthrobacter sp. NPDC056691 TaxID=3345913 RepID=UPI00366BEDAD
MSYPQYPSQQPYPSQHQAWQGEPPLWAPYYGAPFPAAVKRFFKKYATFSGRASRSEYWWWALVSIIVSFVLNIAISVGTAASSSSGLSSSPQLGPGATFGMILLVIWGLATIVPSIALTVRRLHDSNKSGWMALLGLIPFAGPIILLVFALLGPDPAGQRFDQPTGY